MLVSYHVCISDSVRILLDLDLLFRRILLNVGRGSWINEATFRWSDFPSLDSLGFLAFFRTVTTLGMGLGPRGCGAVKVGGCGRVVAMDMLELLSSELPPVGPLLIG